jgi:type VI secretion system secreted protein Hcp
VAIADMFLKVQGVTGESADAQHKGEIAIKSWAWGAQGSPLGQGARTGKATLTELQVVKVADQSSPTLLRYLWTHKVFKATLSVRKAGTEPPLEYLRVDLEDALVASWKTEVVGTEVVEHVSLAFRKATLAYTPQGATGGPGGGKNEVAVDADAGGQ